MLVKGRNNYLCQRRLEQAGGRAGYLFETEPQARSLMMIEDWAQKSLEARGVGSLSELPEPPEPSVWDKVCAEAGNCLNKKCPFYKDCFWQAARRRMTGANVLVVNHALLFSDLALRMAGVSYLPKYDLLDPGRGPHGRGRGRPALRAEGERGRRAVRPAGAVRSTAGEGDADRPRVSLADDAVKDVLELNDAVRPCSSAGAPTGTRPPAGGAGGSARRTWCRTICRPGCGTCRCT